MFAHAPLVPPRVHASARRLQLWLDVDSLHADPARAEIVDSMHVMSNAANRLVVSAQLRLRRLPDHRDSSLAGEIQQCVTALLADFDRLRALLWTLQHADAADESD